MDFIHCKCTVHFDQFDSDLLAKLMGPQDSKKQNAYNWNWPNSKNLQELADNIGYGKGSQEVPPEDYELIRAVSDQIKLTGLVVDGGPDEIEYMCYHIVKGLNSGLVHFVRNIPNTNEVVVGFSYRKK